jgi:hypothetical protein
MRNTRYRSFVRRREVISMVKCRVKACRKMNPKEDIRKRRITSSFVFAEYPIAAPKSHIHKQRVMKKNSLFTGGFGFLTNIYTPSAKVMVKTIVAIKVR